MVKWLEAEDYDVSYATNIDVDLDPNLLLAHKGFLSVGCAERRAGQLRRRHVHGGCEYDLRPLAADEGAEQRGLLALAIDTGDVRDWRHSHGADPNPRGRRPNRSDCAEQRAKP